MHIVHLVESYSPLSETFIYDIIRRVDNIQGVKTTVITFNPITEHRELKPFVVLRGKKDISFYKNIIKGRFTGDREQFNFARYMMYSKDLKKQLSKLNPDVLHCHFGTMAILGLKATKESNIPTIGSFYGYDISTNLKLPIWVSNYKKSLPNLTATIGISNHIKNKVEKFTKSKSELIHLPINTDDFEDTRPSNRHSDIVKLIFIGRLVDKKSPLELLDSFKTALELNSKVNIHLTMIGDGPLYKDCETFIQKYDLHSYVDLMGAQAHNITMEKLKNSHIYVQHSVTAPNGDQEGQGVTLVEASAYGLPVIVTDHNGFSDVIINNKTGYLVPEHDTKAMAERIIELATNPLKWNELGLKGREHIAKHFNSKIETEKLISLYKNCINA